MKNRTILLVGALPLLLLLLVAASRAPYDTFVGDGSGLTGIPRSGVTGLENALDYLTNNIGGVGGSATNAVSKIMTNGVAVGTSITNLNFVDAGNTTVTGWVSGASVNIGVSSTGGGSQTPWTTDINAAGFRLTNIASLKVADNFFMENYLGADFLTLAAGNESLSLKIPDSVGPTSTADALIVRTNGHTELYSYEKGVGNVINIDAQNTQTWILNPFGNGAGLTNIQEAALVYPAANPAAGLVLTSTSSNTAAWLPSGGASGTGIQTNGGTGIFNRFTNAVVQGDLGGNALLVLARPGGNVTSIFRVTDSTTNALYFDINANGETLANGVGITNIIPVALAATNSGTVGQVPKRISSTQWYWADDATGGAGDSFWFTNSAAANSISNTFDIKASGNIIFDGTSLRISNSVVYMPNIQDAGAVFKYLHRASDGEVRTTTDGSALTSLNASALASGTVNSSRLTTNTPAAGNLLQFTSASTAKATDSPEIAGTAFIGTVVVTNPPVLNLYASTNYQGSNVVYQTNAAVQAPDFSKVYQLFSTNDAFTFSACQNVHPARHETAVVYVTNSAAAYKAVTPPATTYSQGTWAVTNVSVFTFTHYGRLWTNAVALPLY